MCLFFHYCNNIQLHWVIINIFITITLDCKVLSGSILNKQMSGSFEPSLLSIACMFSLCMVIVSVRFVTWTTVIRFISVYCMITEPRCSVHHTVSYSVRSSLLLIYGCEWLLCCSLLPFICVILHMLITIHVWFGPQGSESESVNGPGRDSGLASSRLEPSATLPGRGGAESEPETMEGMLCRKQEMESHNKKAATRWVLPRRVEEDHGQ